MSITVTVKLHVLLLPLLSRAVLVTVVTPSGNTEPLAGTLVTFATAQLSLAVTLNVTLLTHKPGAALTIRLAGQLITGGWLSITVTVNVHVALLPLASRAVLVTVVTPTENTEPLAGALVMFVTEQLSLAVTVNVTLLVHKPAAALTIRLLEQVITGGCVSGTTVNWALEPLWPLPSSAIKVMLVAS